MLLEISFKLVYDKALNTQYKRELSFLNPQNDYSDETNRRQKG